MVARLLRFPRDNKPDVKTAPARPDWSQLSAAEREFLPALLEIQESPPAPLQRAVLWAIGAAVAVALVWAAWGSLDVVSTAPGRFIPDGRVKTLQVTETAVVKAIHVKEGQQVKAGDLLMELDPALANADYTSSRDSLTQNELGAARLAAELTGSAADYGSASPDLIALQETLRRAREEAHQAKLATARTQVAEKAAALAGAEATRRKLVALLDVATEKEKNSKALLADEFLSRVEYLKDYQNLVAAENDLTAQIKAVEQAQHAKLEAEQALALTTTQRHADVLQELNQNMASRPDLRGRFDKAREIQNLKWLRAPVSGYVQSVAITTTGGVVTPAQTLVTIVPEGTPLIVEANLSNEDIGYVKAGQPVEIKIDTYPFQRYGALKGKVTWISPDADQRDNGTANADQQDLATRLENQKTVKTNFSYRMHIAPDPGSTLIVDGQRAALKPGMSVQADVQTDKRKIYEFVFAPVVKYLNEGTQVR